MKEILKNYFVTKRKPYAIALILFVLLLIFIFLISTQSKGSSNSDRTGTSSPSTSNSKYVVELIDKNIEVNENKDFIFEKSIILLIQLLRQEDTYLKDSVFSNNRNGSIEELRNKILDIGLNVKFKILKIITYPNVPSGVVYINIKGVSTELNLSLEYSKDQYGQWKLMNYEIIEPDYLQNEG